MKRALFTLAFFLLTGAAAVRASDLYCWGRNDYGQLGTNNTVEYHVPTLASVVKNAGLNPIQVSGGWYHNCILNENGTVWCWGGNSYGAISADPSQTFFTPIETERGDGLPLTNIIQISSGGPFICALADNGTVWCWGSNTYGELGRETPSNTENFAGLVVRQDGSLLTNIIKISAGDYHICALAENGTVWCWGRNNYGQLGDGTGSDRNYAAPVKMQDGSVLSGIIDVSGGAWHTCALAENGTVWCWGRNDHGQIGDGTTTDRYYPVEVKESESSILVGITRIVSGAYHTCALSANGSLLCWGESTYGEVGAGTFESINPYPLRVKTEDGSFLENVSEFSSGCYHTCAITANGSVYCWGGNLRGQIGDGTTTDRPLAVDIGFSASRLWLDGCALFSCAIASLFSLTVSPERLIFTRPDEIRAVSVSVSGTVIDSVVSSNPSVFEIKNDSCTGSSSDCTFEVVFRPKALIDYSGTITINYGAGSKTISAEAHLSTEAESPVACTIESTDVSESRAVDRAFLIILRKGSCIRE